MNQLKLTKLFSFCLVFVFALSANAVADSNPLVGKVAALENAMKDMQKTVKWQKEKITALESRKEKTPVPAQYKGEEAFKDGLEQYIGDSHKWLKNTKFFGDMRLRMENRNNHAAGSQDRNRFRFRLRFGFKRDFAGPFDGDKMQVGFRLASAANTGRDSTNTTLDTSFAYKDISIDRAWVKYEPEFAKIGPITDAKIVAGKFANPLIGSNGGSTWLTWDSDVTPEGIYEQFHVDLLASEDMKLKGVVTLGQFILEEGGGSDHSDAELYAYQAVLKSDLKGGLKTKHGLSYYSYDEYDLNFTAAGGNLTGTGNQSGRLATDFDVINIYNEVGFPSVGIVPKSKIYFDWNYNLSESANDAQGGGQNKAWMLGYKLGKAKKKGSWELKYEYAWIEANSVAGAFTDSDFGGTDARGSVVKAKYAITDNLKIGLAFFRTNNIKSHDRFNGIIDNDSSLFQTDLVWKIA